MIELSNASPFAWFVGCWWGAFMFHFMLHFMGFATKWGRWSEVLVRT